MLPLKSSSRFQLDLGIAATFEAAGAECFGIPPANFDVPIDMPRGFLSATTIGLPWLCAKGKEEVVVVVAAADCITAIMIDRDKK